mmetsp:Transcript_8127/g.18853  ORF Transcript_8127/g.18853 Transcript_8127/m.18853 type:complete len:255 (+) Transcript_8127:54-818(+)
MAAVLCTSVAELCQGCVNAICVLPCRACGITCGTFCDTVRKVCTSPFFPYLLVTYCLNLIPLGLGIKTVPWILGLEKNEGGAGEEAKNCRAGALWLVVNAILALVHLVASLYIVHKIQKEEQDVLIEAPVVQMTDAKPKADTTTAATASATPVVGMAEEGTVYHHMVTNTSNSTPSSSWGRLRHVLCFDKGVALYILVAIVWMVWQTMGLSRYIGLDGGCDDIRGRILSSVLCGWLYVSLVGIAFLCSLCCMRL